MENSKNNKGFTLVELITVVAILTILSAMGVSAFGNVTEQARRQAIHADGLTLVAALNNYNALVTQEGHLIGRGSTSDFCGLGLQLPNGMSTSSRAIFGGNPTFALGPFDPYASQTTISVTHTAETGFLAMSTTLNLDTDHVTILLGGYTVGEGTGWEPVDGMPTIHFDTETLMWRVIP